MLISFTKCQHILTMLIIADIFLLFFKLLVAQPEGSQEKKAQLTDKKKKYRSLCFSMSCISYLLALSQAYLFI